MTRDLYECHFEELMRYCLQLCRSREAALDLVQETFLKALEREEVMEAYSPEQRRAWLYKAARNLFLDGVRKAPCSSGSKAFCWIRRKWRRTALAGRRRSCCC